MAYLVGAFVVGLILPRLEHTFFADYVHTISVASAQAHFSGVSSGMMALTGIVFTIAFVMMTFGAVAYSPRLVVLFGTEPGLFHTLGIFFATFTYSLAALAWTDRGGSGAVPLLSALLAAALLLLSLVRFALMVQKLSDLQITNVLHFIGEKGRSVIRSTFHQIEDSEGVGAEAETSHDFGPATQTLTYSGQPRAITELNIEALVLLAQNAGAVIAIECAVGDTLVEDATLLRVHGSAGPLPEQALRQAINLANARTFTQDPKYAIRLLVDVAIRALSPAINDPTTAVQALDQIEDLLRQLGRSKLDAGRARDAEGVLRLVFPMPTWEDYLGLALDEIRQFGRTSIQVVRRLRSALVGLADTVRTDARRRAVQRYLEHLNASVNLSDFDDQDRITALQEDRQGLGMSRIRAKASA